MTCPKCGNEIKEGHLYCDVCGEEIRIVPDFDETVDDPLKLSLTDVIDTEGVLQGLEKVATKEIAKEIDKEATKEISISNKVDKESLEDTPDNKLLIKALVITGAICAVLAILGIAINSKVNSYYSVDSQYEKAFIQFEEAKYEDSIKTLKHAISIASDDTRLKLLLADDYYMLGKYDESNAVLYELLDQFPEDQSIYDKIIKNYEALSEYDEINNLLGNADDDKLNEDYSDYIVNDVNFSIPEGAYDDVQYLELTSLDGSTIYYTMDGTIADKTSLVYSEPIELDNGEYIINAVAINEIGISSANIEKKYTIDYEIPEAPTVTQLESVYNVPINIEAKFADYDLCYYTVDGEDPTTEDTLYQGPIAMYIGKHTYKFAVINSKGVSSDVVSISASLDLITLVDMETATNNLISWKNSKGSSDYTYECEQAYLYKDNVYYIINEYSMDGEKKNQTGNHYAVDVLTGLTFRAILNKSTGEYTLEALL